MKGLGGVAVLVMATAVVEAIRVYEGTKLGRPDNITRRSDPPRKIHGSQLKYSKELKPTPELYKVKLTQQGYLQFLRYLTDIPPLREYTFCIWLKPNNVSHPQPIFSYTVQERSELLSFWYEPKDATLRMSIRKDLVLKIPAILRDKKWHHICQSWNGIRGEWIIFLDGTKIGSGQLHKYIGTYIPGGGEVVVGQQPSNFHEGLDGGIEGEVFAFNLVDESVKDDVFIAKWSEPAQPIYVPPFKTLPPMKKSYQEIKAFIKSLPNEPISYRMKNGVKIAGGYPGPKSSKPGPRPQRTKQRRRYKPITAIIYERDDRQLPVSDAQLVSKIGIIADRPLHKGNQDFNENYSIHSYRIPKEKRKTIDNYEIHETQDEEDNWKEGKRKARQNFNIYTAREANTFYAKTNKLRRQKKPVYHFEILKDKQKIRSLKIDIPLTKKSIVEPKKPIKFTPVHEIIEDDAPFFRRKRDTNTDDLTTNFRPLPKIPDGFIDNFARTSEKPEIEKQLNSFPNRKATSTTITERFHPDINKSTSRNDILQLKSHIPLQRNLVVSVKDLVRRPGNTAGTELVKRSYENCTSDRGSPVKYKDRLVVSWADTPVRIYGGAIVTTAVNVCGHF